MADAPWLVCCLVVVALGSAGCTQPAPYSAPAVAHASCAPAYPDGAAKDCAADIAHPADPHAPAWRCLGTSDGGINGWQVTYRLLIANDTVALAYAGHDKPSFEHVVSLVTVLDGDGLAVLGPVAVRGLGDGSATLGQAELSQGRWIVRTWAFDGDGAFDTRTTLWGATPWFVHAVGEASADAMAEAATPDGGTVWVTTPTTVADVHIDDESVYGASSPYGGLLPGDLPDPGEC